MSNQIENSENVLSGNQIRDIKGNLHVGNTIHIYDKKPINKYLTTPPFQTDYFIGRATDITAIHEKIFTQNHLLLLNGRGGMGKSTIAAKYFKKYESDYQYLAWIFVVESLLDALLTLAIPLQVEFGEKMPNEERLPLLLKAMVNLKKPGLLVIDNLNDPEELQKYYLALRTCPNFHFLITTRITYFENAAQHEVKPLERDDRFSLFRKHYPKLKSEEHQLLSSIMLAVGNNTLVIELLAKNLRQFNRLKTNYSLAQLWEDLQQKGLLSIQGRAVTTAYQAGDQLRESTPETIIAAMYDLNDISAAECQLLSIFAVLPAENIPFTILEDLLPKLEGLEDNLLSLAELGWLEFDETATTFKVSPVVQEIVMQKNENLLADGEVFFDRLNELLEFDFSTGNLLNVSFNKAVLLVYYSENIISSIAYKNNDIARLCERVGKYFETTGDLVNALKYFEEFSNLEQDFLAQNPDSKYYKNTLAISYERLGQTYSSLGEVEQALKYFGLSNSINEELHKHYPQDVGLKNNLAISYSKLGTSYVLLENFQEALNCFEKCKELNVELVENHPNNVRLKEVLAMSHSQIGETYNSLEKPHEALEYLEKAKSLFEELYEKDSGNIRFKNNLAVFYSKLEEAYTLLEQLEKVLEYAQRYNDLRQELYKSYPENVTFKNGLAISYSKLGKYYQKMKNVEQAKLYMEQAKKHWEELVNAYPAYVKFQDHLSWVDAKIAEL
ncbi:MAG: tetratricopeptide repeat protein [Bacteroidota bacterium]